MNPTKENQRKRDLPSSRRKKRTGLTGIAIVVIVAIVAGFLAAPYISQYIKNRQSAQKKTQIQVDTPTTNEEKADTSQLTFQEAPLESLGETEQKTIETADKEQSTCDEVSNSILSFYKHLDNQPYIKEAQLQTKSGIYFTKLIQKLLDNPPVVTRETDDLFTILQNTAHFFRVIGKKNIFIIKGILHNEKNLFEDTLANYFDFIGKQNCSMKDLTLKIPENSLYDYAGFFLNTMGGRLYLFRRDSHSRMVIIYYALLIIDQANQNNNNRYGIQINQPLDSLIAEIESVGTHLKRREEYLDKLYDLKEKYQ